MGVARYFHISGADEARLLGDRQGGQVESEGSGRFRIARHHFPISLLQHFSSKGLLFRIAPLSMEVLEKTGCYRDVNPPPQQDPVFRYVTDLGPGVSKRAAKRMKGGPHFRVVPCV